MANLNQRPVAFYPIYAQLTGSINAGLLLSQLLYWYSAVNKSEFYKTDIEISQETWLSEKELRNAKARLKLLSFINITNRGLPPVTYYDFNLEAMAAEIAILKPTKGRIQYRRKGEHNAAQKAGTKTPIGRDALRPMGGIYTENTQETTTETTSEITFSEKKENETPNVKLKKQKADKTPTVEEGFAQLSDPDFLREMEVWTNGIINVAYQIEYMKDYVLQSGKRYKNYKAFARNWIRRACEKAKVDWDAKQPAQVGLTQNEINEVLEDLRRKEEYRRTMGY